MTQPNNSDSFISSNTDQLNVHRELGTNDSKLRQLWPGTRKAIEADGLSLGQDLGQGGFGIVIAAREKSTNRKLAVKVLDEPSNEKKLQQFRKEIRMLASETIPLHIVPHLRYAREVNAAATLEERSQPYLVMEQIDGQTVYDYAVKNELSVERKIELVERVFAAFAELHERGIVHGDPSPKNVMVEKGDRVRIIDFGGSREINSVLQSLTSQTQAGGTVGYSPLARLNGEEKASLWSDIYGAAAVAFHLFTGKKTSEVAPTESSFLQHLAAARVPGGIAAIIARGLRSKDSKYGPNDDDPRLFQSAQDMAAT